MTLAAQGSYQRNTTAVRTALLEIRKADPQAVVMVGAYKPIAEFIKLSKRVKLDATFVTISFVGSNALAAELGEQGEGVVITQVVPFPWDVSTPVVADYTAALKAVDGAAEPGFVSLEGYLVGRMTVAALQEAGRDIDRHTLLDVFYGGASFDLGGLTVDFGPDDVQGSDSVYLTKITADGHFEPIEGFGQLLTGDIK